MKIPFILMFAIAISGCSPSLEPSQIDNKAESIQKMLSDFDNEKGNLCTLNWQASPKYIATRKDTRNYYAYTNHFNGENIKPLYAIGGFINQYKTDIHPKITANCTDSSILLKNTYAKMANDGKIDDDEYNQLYQIYVTEHHKINQVIQNIQEEIDNYFDQKEKVKEENKRNGIITTQHNHCSRGGDIDRDGICWMPD